MKYNVEGILKNDGAKIDIDVCKSDDELGLVLGDIKLDEMICCTGQIKNVSRVLNFNADLVINYNVPCGRCLNKVIEKQEVLIDVNIPNIDETNDKDEYCYSDGLLDLGIIINDSILTALPLKHLCSDDCKGLCDVCGKDLNFTKCNCTHEKIDERFAELKKYSV
jgi:uncharacterized protein